MKAALFPKLAWTGIVKNRKLYIPYIISAVGMVMMYFIIDFLSRAEAVVSIKGGSNLTAILSMGKFVIAAFALLFLLYTNSFLIRRRNTEFGLYNILGMNRRNIGRIVTLESLFVFLISLSAGIFLGIVFSKLGELVLLYMSHAETDYGFSLPADTLKFTVIIFAVIFLVLWIKSLIQLHRSDPLELMNSEKAGEKPPKANPVFAVLGAAMLIAAYIMAVTTTSPIDALFRFLAAVIMVIIATYLLFMSGSVALCRLLQKNKKYYYKKNHFVSVSSMTYRMKRNGAGLASICILSTMVLVMIASSGSLYFGTDEALKSRFPVENQLSLSIPSLDGLTEENLTKIRNAYEEAFTRNDVHPENITEYTYASITGLLEDGRFDPDASRLIDNLIILDNLRTLYFISAEDYNRMTGADVSVQSGEALVYTMRCSYDRPVFEMGGMKLKIKGKLDSFPEISEANVLITPSIFMVISDMNELKPLDTLADFNGDRMLNIRRYYGYDLPDVSDEKTIEVFKEQRDAIPYFNFINVNGETGFNYFQDCLAEQKDDFFSTFGGLFFIGIMLSIIFIFAMAMIIYYKQISEGYEDRSRFEIMQNVGMTKKDIKKSINSQILTVFFAPLVFAGLHLCFAFPPTWKILQLFNLNNLPFVIAVTAIAFAVFGIFYAVIYKLTAGAYYRIVSGSEE